MFIKMFAFITRFFQEEPLLFVKQSDRASTPVKGSTDAAGYDLYSAECMTIEPKCKGNVSTDLSIKPPAGTYARIAPRSGLADRMIDVGGGVVDRDYTGVLKIILYNFSDDALIIQEGDRVAQLILEKISCTTLKEVDELPKTQRGSRGFGSTGIRMRHLVAQIQ